MAGIMVYIPGGGSREDFPRLGLSSLLEDGVTALAFECANGPDGGRGSLVVFDNPRFPSNTPRAYDGASQTWMFATPDGELPSGRYWVGYVTSQRPSPEELQRNQPFDSFPVVLDDKRIWLIPVAEMLPQRLTRDRATGAETKVAKPEHREFTELANAAFDYFLSDGFEQVLKRDRRIVMPDGFRLARLALEKNYRVNADVIDLLGLLDDLCAVNIGLVASGVGPAGELLAQKKSMEQSSRSPVLS